MYFGVLDIMKRYLFGLGHLWFFQFYFINLFSAYFKCSLKYLFGPIDIFYSIFTVLYHRCESFRFGTFKKKYFIEYYNLIDQKGMTFDHDFGYSFPLFQSLLEKQGRRKGECILKIVIKNHAFLLDLIIFPYTINTVCESSISGLKILNKFWFYKIINFSNIAIVSRAVKKRSNRGMINLKKNAFLV